MNLIITDRCNRACPYCFAGKKMGAEDTQPRPHPALIPLDAVSSYLDFLERSEVHEFKILGGEPSLHPQLTDIVQLGLNRGFKVIIFTNGLWPDSTLSGLGGILGERLSFIVNVNEPELQDVKEWERLCNTLKVIGAFSSLGFNIYRPDFSLHFIPGLVRSYGLKPEVRLGLASPIVGGKNTYLSETVLPLIGKKLTRQLEELERQEVLGSFDCGFPLCMFDQLDLGALALATRQGFLSVCDIIIDVGPDLSAWPCFPLGDVLTVNLMDFKNRQGLIDYFTKKLLPLRRLGSMNRCISCKYIARDQCCGGCLGRTIRHWEENGDPQLLEKVRCIQ